MVEFESKYAYSVARTRVLETRLLDWGRLERMLDAADVEEALKVLQESDYSVGFDYEAMLSNELKRVYALLSEMAPDPRLVRMFLVRYDFHNLKVLLKARLLWEGAGRGGVDAGQAPRSDRVPKRALFDIGSVKLETLARAVNEGEVRDLPEPHRAALQRALAAYEETRDPVTIDNVLDREAYSFMCAEAAGQGIDFLVDYLARQADLINIATFIRSKQMGKDRSSFTEAFLPCGRLELSKFLDVYDRPPEAIADEFAGSDYAPIIEDGLKHLAADGSLSYFEKARDIYLLNYLKKAKYVAFGPEPLIGYLLAKENEIRMLRIILVGKANGLTRETIKERLRDVYV
ncbi:MAG TPA: V-type ATP synthase subunit C [Firmicutes bacterium]|nr:V-type ATP synthase subunit C [Bacillota bacterium]